MAENPKQNLQSTEIMAKLFELDPRRVQQLAKEGILPAASQRPYKFDLLPTVKAYIRYLRDRANGKEAKTADTVKAKIAELQLKELEGKMHRSEDVEALTNDLVYTARSMIMALPGRLAMDVVQAGSANEASALIRTECYKILNELAGYQYDPEAYRRRVRDREGWSDALADEEADE